MITTPNFDNKKKEAPLLGLQKEPEAHLWVLSSGLTQRMHALRDKFGVKMLCQGDKENTALVLNNITTDQST